MNDRLIIKHTPSDADRAAIIGPLSEFNAAHGYPTDSLPLAILLRNDDGDVVGGLYAKTGYGWLFVEFLVVPESMRRSAIGTELMNAAERIAVERGCVGAWLTTFTLPSARLLREARL